MKWTRISLETNTDNEPLITDMLCEKGFEGIEIIDNVPLNENDMAKMFIDIPPELDESNKTAIVNVYIDTDVDVNEKIDIINQGLEELSIFIDVSAVKITVSETEDKDWMNNWKQFFKAFRIDDSIVVKPTWEELPEDVKPDDIIIQIDPGSAFGTGAHETTKLCILALKKYLKKGMDVLDVGTGSGILSIASRFLGAGRIIGTDIDPNAVVVARENAVVNKIAVSADESFVDDDTITFLCGNLNVDAEFREKVGLKSYDIVVANILADIIMPLSDVVREHMKDGGLFISSGILNTREQEVVSRLTANGFEIVEIIRMGDWISIVAR
jgi:ribosomal protein L11 methyltransferase